MDGLNIVGVQFRRAGRIYDFTADGVDLRVGDDVVVDTERGPSLARVAQLRFLDGGTTASKEVKELKPIMRVASQLDIDETNRLLPETATSYARERVERLKLKMTVLQSEVQFGGNKVIVYFSAPGRVDFRDLVKELASGLKARVELKQVGARDEAKLVGGLGICGREFCCSSFLREFVPVSIKMAKNQNLALNPSKVSGGCGRLLCCLTYENDLYVDLRKKLPPRGTRVRSIEDGVVGDVIKGDILNQVVVIETEDGRQLMVPVAQLEIVERKRATAPQPAEETEAEAWGEDIDVAGLAGLDDDKDAKATAQTRAPREGGGGRGGKPDRGPKPTGGQQGDHGSRPPQGDRGPKPQGQGQVQGPGGQPGQQTRAPGEGGERKRRRGRDRKGPPKPPGSGGGNDDGGGEGGAS